MDKRNKSINVLIKRKGLISLLKKFEIKRISKKAEEELGLFLFENFENLFLGLKEEMDISGKRILDEKVMESFISNQNKKKEIDY